MQNDVLVVKCIVIGFRDEVDYEVLCEAIEATDWLDISDKLAIEIIQQYGMGAICDEEGEKLVKIAVDREPWLAGCSSYDLAGVLYREYYSRLLGVKLK